jgi:hypothetical protein
VKLFVIRDASILARCVQFVSTIIVNAKKPLCVYIGPEQKLRTRAQNDLLWAIYTEIADATGFDKDDLHEYFKKRFLGAEVADVWGTKVERVRSSTQLSTVDFSDFVECILACAAEQGIEIKNRPAKVFVER